MGLVAGTISQLILERDRLRSYQESDNVGTDTKEVSKADLIRQKRRDILFRFCRAGAEASVLFLTYEASHQFLKKIVSSRRPKSLEAKPGFVTDFLVLVNYFLAIFDNILKI